MYNINKHSLIFDILIPSRNSLPRMAPASILLQYVTMKQYPSTNWYWCFHVEVDLAWYFQALEFQYAANYDIIRFINMPVDCSISFKTCEGIKFTSRIGIKFTSREVWGKHYCNYLTMIAIVYVLLMSKGNWQGIL